MKVFCERIASWASENVSLYICNYLRFGDGDLEDIPLKEIWLDDICPNDPFGIISLM